jgi:hypothetical protein
MLTPFCWNWHKNQTGTSLLLDPELELWKNILEKKVRIYITQYERNRIGKIYGTVTRGERVTSRVQHRQK